MGIAQEPFLRPEDLQCFPAWDKGGGKHAGSVRGLVGRGASMGMGDFPLQCPSPCRHGQATPSQDKAMVAAHPGTSGPNRGGAGPAQVRGAGLRGFKPRESPPASFARSVPGAGGSGGVRRGGLGVPSCTSLYPSFLLPLFPLSCPPPPFSLPCSF